MKHPVLAFLLLTLLSGCASTWRGVDEQFHFDPTSKNIIYRDQWVQRNPPEVHVQPAIMGGAAPSVLFVPFRVSQQIDNPTILGYSVARTVWQTWLTMQLFPAMEFSGDDTPYRRDRAIALGRARGADMVVGGFVTYVLAGGTAGPSQISIQLEAHDTRSGQLVWSMAQAGFMPTERTTDYFIFATKTRTPADPLHAIIQALASDMGLEMQKWTVGPPEYTDSEQYDRALKEKLLPPRDPVPPPRGTGSRDRDPLNPAF